jgi:hypothetical protein
MQLTLEKIITDIPIKVISSLVFLIVVLILFKPKIRIAPFICYDNKTDVYRLKIVNCSLFSAFDIKVELHLLEKYSTPPSGMMNVKYEMLKMKYDHIFFLPPYRTKWMRKEASHCMRLRPLCDIKTLIKPDNQSIQINIFAKHGLTGLTKVFTYEYSDISQIKDGKYTYGTKFDFIPNN